MRNVLKFAAVAGMLVGTTACDLLGSKKKSEEKTVITTKAVAAQNKLCASNATYARLKESAFDEAKRIRERDTEALDALADASVVRMENPLLENRDDALGLTVCSGRMVLELPPGAGAAFDGRPRLAADITYSAQTAADGSGTVFKIDGGEPIVYRLASFDPQRSSSTRTASVEGEGLETIDVAEDAPPPPPARNPLPLRPTVDDDDAAEADRDARAERAALAAVAARRAQAVAAARAKEERAAAAERAARTERVAEARRIERGERLDEGRATATARPSFNCRYARSRVERRICGSNELAARDREMASLYYRTNDRAEPAVRRRLSASRLRFLAYRDRCPDDACVAAAYEDRMDEIRDLADE